MQDITEMGGGELILSPSTGSAVAHPVNIRSTSIPTSNSFGSRWPPLHVFHITTCIVMYSSMP